MQACAWCSCVSPSTYRGRHALLLCSGGSSLSPSGIRPTRRSPAGFPLSRFTDKSRLNLVRDNFSVQRCNANAGAGGYSADSGQNAQEISQKPAPSDVSTFGKPDGVSLPWYLAGLVLGSCLIVSAALFMKRGPSALMSAIAKSGFTAAFTLIFVSEIGDKGM